MIKKTVIRNITIYETLKITARYRNVVHERYQQVQEEESEQGSKAVTKIGQKADLFNTVCSSFYIGKLIKLGSRLINKSAK